jgi:Ca2+-binding EF-hand superfamily protein
MLFALGAVSGALDLIQSLTNSKSSASQDATNPFAIDSGSTSGGTTPSANAGKLPQIAPETMNALFAAQSQSSPSAGVATSSATTRDAALKHLFSQIDADGDGKITKTEFEDALGAGGTNLKQADDVFGKLDKDGDGSVPFDEMSSALKGGRGRHGHHRMTEGAGDDQNDPLLQGLQGASGSTVTNADGSTTTSLTYADGSTVTMTRPATSSASSTATSSYNFLEQLIQRQANAIAAQTSSSLSLSV